LTAVRGGDYTGQEITSMAVPRNRVARFLTDSRPQPDSVFYSLSNFYREEFIKCQRCLDAQREYYSDRAISEVEQALTKVLAQLDRLCKSADADRVVSRLLQQFDTVARPSAWSDPRHTH
jgi:hypothetical protein